MLHARRPAAPGSEVGLTGTESLTDVRLSFEIQTEPGTNVVAKIHQVRQDDQASNSYHLMISGATAYVARHNHIFHSCALVTGTWLILSRRLELDCDRRAACVIGHRQAASALWKIHADHPFRGLIEFLIGAVNSHPSRDQRLAAIYRDAPDGDRPEVEWDWRLLARRRLAAWLAVFQNQVPYDGAGNLKTPPAFGNADA